MKLFYSIKTEHEAAFLNTLTNLSKKLPNFSTVCTTTRQKSANPKIIYNERFTFDTIKKNLPHAKKTYFLICGSIEFVDKFWETLGENGIKEERIKTEAFY